MQSHKLFTTPALAGGIVLGAALVLSPGLSIAQGSLQTQSRETIYGSQLMTPQEQDEYRSQMRNAQSAEAREQIRREHRDRMQARARERNLLLPEEPPARGRVMGPGGNMDQGRGLGPGGDGRQNRRQPMGQGRGMGMGEGGARDGGGQR